MRYLDPKADLTFKHVFGEHRRPGDQLAERPVALKPQA